MKVRKCNAMDEVDPFPRVSFIVNLMWALIMFQPLDVYWLFMLIIYAVGLNCDVCLRHQ